MRKQQIITGLVTSLLLNTTAAAHDFVDLTSSQMRIDTILPKISHYITLPEGYQDSLYTVKLLYPEYTPLTRKQRKAYRKLTGKNTAPNTPKMTLTTYQERKNGTLRMELTPIVTHNDRLCFINSFMPDVIASVAATTYTSTRSTENTQTYADNSVLREGTWAKIRVTTTGTHQLTADVIRQAGFSDLSKVKVYGYGGALIPDRLTQDYLREHDDLKEIATCTVGGVKYFYAQGPVSWDTNTAVKRNRNFFSDYGYYFITEATDTPLSCSEGELLQQVTSSPDAHHYLYENDKYAWAEMGRNLFDGTAITSSAPMTVDVEIPAGNSTANIQVAVSAGAAATYRITCADKESNGSFSFGEYYKAGVKTASFTINDLTPYTDASTGVAHIPVVINAIGASSTLRLDYVSACFDTPATPAPLASGNYPVAQYYKNITNQNHHADTSADIIIIIPTSQKLKEQAERLAECHRQYDGMSARVIPADELYNEFSSGTPDMAAYKRYLKMLHDRATDSKDIPKHVLLFGDAVWDNRMLTLTSTKYSPDDYLLCYETENSYYSPKSIATDDYITVLQDNMAIHTDSNEGIDTNLQFDESVGRIPVTQTNDAKAVVDKIIHYITSSPAGSWQNEIMFIGDDGDYNSHMANINANADNIINSARGYNVKKVMLDAYELKSTSAGNTYPDATATIKKQQNDGALIMNYGGHASWVLLSHEKLLVLSDFANFKGTNYSLWFTAGCETVPFDATTNTLGETALLNASGGAIAFIGTVRTVYESDNTKMDKAFMKHALEYDSEGNPLTIGEAMRLAKNDLVKNGPSTGDMSINKHHYTIIGDPAMRLALPKDSVVIDYINETSTTETCSIKGNSTVNVRGHIARRGSGNTVVSDFNGTANILVMDSKQTITCRNNNPASDSDTQKFTYYDRPSTLFKGTYNVKDGQFAFTFKVPRDIYNDNGTGLITVYAIDPDKRMAANGESSSFIASGWEDINNDLVGPSIHAYLNSPTFSNNDAVGRTPFFVAEISDKDGINTSSSSIGHNMELVIDKQPDMTYDLSNNFLFDNNSYTTGQTYYVIPTLTPGSHSLSFKAWDLLGNSNTVSLDFRVVKGMQPEVSDVSVAPNPVTDVATFYVTHDMQGSQATINIDIIDPSGRVVDILQWDDVFSETSPTTTYRWTPSGISRGLYLYRVRVSCDGSDFVSKTKKLIIAQ